MEFCWNNKISPFLFPIGLSGMVTGFSKQSVAHIPSLYGGLITFKGFTDQPVC